MNTQQYLAVGQTRPLRALPLTILASLEAAGLKMELAPYLRRSQEIDGWFMALDDECVGPVPFAEVMDRLLAGAGSLTVLHETDGEEETPPWQVITYRSWAPKGLAAVAYCIGLWALALAAGWVALCLALPVSLRTPAGWGYMLACAAGGVWFGRAALQRRSETATQEFDSPASQVEAMGGESDAA